MTQRRRDAKSVIIFFCSIKKIDSRGYYPTMDVSGDDSITPFDVLMSLRAAAGSMTAPQIFYRSTITGFC